MRRYCRQVASNSSRIAWPRSCSRVTPVNRNTRGLVVWARRGHSQALAHIPVQRSARYFSKAADEAQFHSLFEEGSKYEDSADFVRAMKAFSEAQAIAEKLDDGSFTTRYNIATLYCSIAACHQNLSNYTEAQEFAHKARRLVTPAPTAKADDEETLSMLELLSYAKEIETEAIYSRYRDEGGAFVSADDWPNALDQFSRALTTLQRPQAGPGETTKSWGILLRRADLYFSIAICHSHLNNDVDMRSGAGTIVAARPVGTAGSSKRPPAVASARNSEDVKRFLQLARDDLHALLGSKELPADAWSEASELLKKVSRAELALMFDLNKQTAESAQDSGDWSAAASSFKEAHRLLELLFDGQLANKHYLRASTELLLAQGQSLQNCHTPAHLQEAVGVLQRAWQIAIEMSKTADEPRIQEPNHVDDVAGIVEDDVGRSGRRSIYDVQVDIAAALGTAYINQGQLDSAEPMCQEAITIANLYPDQVDPFNALRAFAALMERRGNFAEALELYSKAFQDAANRKGLSHPWATLAADELVATALRAGNPAIALEHAKKILAQVMNISHAEMENLLPKPRSPTLPPSSVSASTEVPAEAPLIPAQSDIPTTPAFDALNVEANAVSSILRLSPVLLELGMVQHAQKVTRKAMIAAQTHFGKDHILTGSCETALATALMAKEITDAEPLDLLRDALRITTLHQQGNSMPVAAVQDALSRYYRKKGQLAMARSHAEEALRIEEAAVGEYHPSTLQSRLWVMEIDDELRQVAGQKSTKK